MTFELGSFEMKTLRAFHYASGDKNFVVTTFEDHIPDQFDQVSLDHEPLPPKSRVLLPARNKEGYEYHAFLPKDRQAILNCHLFSCLSETRVIRRDNQYQLDDATKKAWSSLENNLSWSIKCLMRGVLVSLEDAAPPLAEKYGYSRSHNTLKGLNFSLLISKHAFILRLAYLNYIQSIKPYSPEDLIPPWIQEVSKSSHYTWVDSLWGAIRDQRFSRNYIGTLLRPTALSVRWVASAAARGVPIWVLWCNDVNDYKKLEGGHVIKPWHPTTELVAAVVVPQPTPSAAEPHGVPSFPTPPTTAPPAGLHNSAPSFPTLPTTTLPPGNMFVPDWQEFFQKRNEADEAAEAVATLTEKQQWENRRKVAQGYHQPGRKGARVYTWTEAESGGYIRELVDRRDVWCVWDNYRRRDMLFNARGNTWDLCPMLGDSVDGPDQELDELDDAEDELAAIQDQWFLEPQVPAKPPDTDLTELAFLYRRYGFLSVDPISVQGVTPKRKMDSVRKIPGLTQTGIDDHLGYLNDFISAILQQWLPDGYCDFSPNAPDNERFPVSTPSVADRMLLVNAPGFGDAVFLFAPRDNRLNVLIQDPLTVAEMVRMEVQTGLAPVIDYLLRNGSRFALLAERTVPMDVTNFRIITFSARPRDWVANADDYRVYMSRLKTFLTDRPYVAAAALSRGGIAWRIVREVLGLDIDLILNGATFEGQATAINLNDSIWWCHAVDNHEWFFLVGGYDILTGSLNLSNHF